jgi:hypothetical protein
MTPAPFLDLARTADAPPLPDPDAPQYLWLIRLRDGSVASHSFSPPASRAEVESWYPGATLEPELEQLA